MIAERLRKRLRKDRPMVSITLRMPADVVDDLKRVAPVLGFSGYQPLIRYYIGQNLRVDLEKLDTDRRIEVLTDALREHGATDATIAALIARADTSETELS
jgi:hypothetical protein